MCLDGPGARRRLQTYKYRESYPCLAHLQGIAACDIWGSRIGTDVLCELLPIDLYALLAILVLGGSHYGWAGSRGCVVHYNSIFILMYIDLTGAAHSRVAVEAG